MDEFNLCNLNTKAIQKVAIAHPSFADSLHQSVNTHLFSVSEIAANIAKKFHCEDTAALIGLLHDFGKYSDAFQCYMQIIINEQSEYYDLDLDGISSKQLKGSIDHSTAGAQWIAKALQAHLSSVCKEDPSVQMYALAILQILSLCVVSHHSGLINNLPEPTGGFAKRMSKSEEEAHFNECVKNADVTVIEKAQQIATKRLLLNASTFLKTSLTAFNLSTVEHDFYLGMYTKLLFSSLIDADRIDSADFENPDNKPERNQVADWKKACKKIERFVAQFSADGPIDAIRADISNNCLTRAQDPQGIFSLTVPTGGGKTYASLRFALHHAKKYNLDRIIYIIPFTSIIEQNADAIRKVLDDENKQSWVLEHHSNLEPEVQTWRSKLAAENWDRPIVLTTMVQFLESTFGSGTRGARRLHQMSNAVLVFDEIQTLPIRCVHLFNNTINYLTRFCKTTAVMCTATQPLLHQLPNEKAMLGQLALTSANELTPDITTLYSVLERVQVTNLTRDGGWSESDLTQLIAEQLQIVSSCLVIVNTKDWAKRLFMALKVQVDKQVNVYHLSTGMCAAHRKALLSDVKARLANGLPTLCISTQLIEAGVDVDFSCVVRFMAGLDSIAQAAGRCNRHGFRDSAKVIVVNPEQENIGMLHDIKTGIDATKRILDEFDDTQLLSPQAMTRYFEYYFYERAGEMPYSIKKSGFTKGKQTLLDLLSCNKNNINESQFPLRHAFMDAAKAFKAIDAPSNSVIVPYNEEAKSIITELCALDTRFNAAEYRTLLKRSQKYSVNLFPNVWAKLVDMQAVYPIGEDEQVYYLLDEFYSGDFGLSAEVSNTQQDLIL
ncbi:CRISPR-associated helicase Cas3' [Pseudoalteromonas prydzensis]|uniref:CRISPR-associated helicase Cas3 n=1 Tax=Pseudoalteromonas prydzensis TaxID=182141 RepID=A0ABR9FKQ4_9GAMM|nr:CRISPR-associated helicase Cas3' [Pseudoalteromonas prydzensis]MBE0457404.1 CRISPR-associated helicase Cas3' [Pseudoalteromonas prydzensis]